MQINKNELLNAIKILDLIVSKGSTGIGSSIYFEGNNLIASNNGILISIPFKTDFKCFINPEKIIKYLEKVKQDSIEVNFDNDNLILKSKKTELILKTYLNIKDIIKLREVKEWKSLPKDFYNGLKYSLYSSTIEQYTKYDFIGYCLFNEEKVFSTNNKKLGEYSFEKKIGNFGIYSNIVLVLLKIKDIIEYSILDNLIVFKTKDNILIYCEKRDITLPDYNKYLDLSNDSIEIDFIDCLIEGIDFCSILNQDIEIDSQIVRFEINKNDLIISVETLEGKLNYNYKLNKEYDEIIKFSLNPSLIKEIINQKDFKCFYESDRIYFMNDNYKFVCSVIN